MRASTFNAVEIDAPFDDFTEAGGVWTNRGPVRHVELRADILHDIAEHMKMTV